jgi:hypothetical protein
MALQVLMQVKTFRFTVYLNYTQKLRSDITDNPLSITS